MNYKIFFAGAVVLWVLFLLSNPAEAQAPILSAEEQYDKKLTQWVEKLATKENCGKGIIDTNGKWSRGDLCFQDGTYSDYSKKHGVYDQKKLAVAMIKDNYKDWSKWRCSVITDYDKCPKRTWNKHIGLPPKEI